MDTVDSKATDKECKSRDTKDLEKDSCLQSGAEARGSVVPLWTSAGDMHAGAPLALLLPVNDCKIAAQY